jgi:hypothetical protein
MSKEKTPMQIAYGDFVGVVWDGDKPNPRTGLMGRLIDFIFGVRVTPGTNTFIAIDRDGKIISSPDGVTWTMRSTPKEPAQ